MAHNPFVTRAEYLARRTGQVEVVRQDGSTEALPQPELRRRSAQRGTFGDRLEAAFLVLIGRADALVWPAQQ